MGFRLPGKARQYRRHKAGVMNRLEKQYADLLDLRIAAKEVNFYWFEEWKFKLGEKCFYTPDFVVQMSDNELVVVETKGGPWQDDARVKAKVFADKFPFRFIGVSYTKKTGWKEEVFK